MVYNVSPANAFEVGADADCTLYNPGPYPVQKQLFSINTISVQ